MIFVNNLSLEARQELEGLTQHSSGRVAQRAWMVLWSTDQVPVPEIARRFHCKQKTVRKWLRRTAVDLRLCLRLLVSRKFGAASGLTVLAAGQPVAGAACSAQAGLSLPPP